MSKFTQFMKANKIEKENGFYAATKSLCDENGNPLLWELRHISSKENEIIRDECTTEIPLYGKTGQYRTKFKTGTYVQKLLCASIVMPDLMNRELQDSYGVCSPEELLLAMVDDPGEYNDFALFVQKFQGFDTTLDDKVEEAKN